MTKYTASHWGIYKVDDGDPSTRPKAFAADTDTGRIGLHQLDDKIMRRCVTRPAMRRSWLEHGPAAAVDKRGQEPIVEIDWPQAVDLTAFALPDFVLATTGRHLIR